jgi:hypothetical protein
MVAIGCSGFATEAYRAHEDRAQGRADVPVTLPIRRRDESVALPE